MTITLTLAVTIVAALTLTLAVTITLTLTQIRAWASKWGWQLMWTPTIQWESHYGKFVPGYRTAAPIRLLDPVVAAAPHAPKVNACPHSHAPTCI